MKIVFEDVFVSASAPKSAADIISRMTRLVGTETLEVYYRRFINELQKMVDDHNAKYKSVLKMQCYKHNKAYTDSAKGMVIRISKKTQGEDKQVARLNATTVHNRMAEYDGELRIFSLDEWDRIKENIKEGGEA